MLELINALLAGMVLGVIFAFFEFPIPAPGSIAGVVGILGVTIGYLLLKHYLT